MDVQRRAGGAASAMARTPSPAVPLDLPPLPEGLLERYEAYLTKVRWSEPYS